VQGNQEKRNPEMIVDQMIKPKKKKSLIFISLVALAFCACLLGCEQNDRKPLIPLEKATIALVTNHNAILANIAQAKGYFQQEGLDVTTNMHPYGKLALQDMLEGKSDFATASETAIMFSVLDGAEISIFATIHKINNDEGIVARTDKGINTPYDLKGKRIGLTYATTTEFFLDTFLSINSISIKEVELFNIHQEKLLEAIEVGKVDAIVAFNPYLINIQKKIGENGITFKNKNIYTKTFNIVSSKKYINNNPEKVKKVLRALCKAERFYKKKPEESLRIAASLNKIDIAEIRGILDMATVELSLNQSLLLALEDESRWAIKKRLTSATNVPNYLDYIYLDGLQSVKPAAIEILK
jgi:ABC-type nitrate/sulfonate/bicarbonate transport system substrate-binding protein